MIKSGVVYLPLHNGKAPKWLFDRMINISKAIAEILIYEYGQDEFLKRISNPYWFQAFSCAIGFDWHSSGTTTTTCGALKIAMDTIEGIKFTGGKGKLLTRVIYEIEAAADKFSLSTNKVEKLKYASKITAKIDNNCIQDGYSLYHHSFIFTESGKWAVIQQGMNKIYARRYHWISDNLKNFIEEPHSAIVGDKKEDFVLDMTSDENNDIRKISLDIVKDNPIHLKKYFSGQNNLIDFFKSNKIIKLPVHHRILYKDISEHGWKTLQRIYEIQPQDYEEMIAIKGVGKKTIRSLALISELLYGSEISWKDSAKFSYCVGGKDKIPYEIDKEHYDDVLLNLKEAIEMAKLNNREKIDAIKRLRNLINY